MLGSALGPAPFPDMVRTFQSVIGNEVKGRSGRRHIDVAAMCACVGGGSNSIGFSLRTSMKESRPIGAGRGW